ncbi:hypothetical protein [Hydrogenophaga sp. 2FB]|uniref:hypothetical protein n=1 Tax=Hydrogenophaga sp. 2FB TaxID=2502187 RepID=UPI0010F7B3A1|nr:hypothetical protein [Hydrogenophaga sp. 2FB]
MQFVKSQQALAFSPVDAVTQQVAASFADKFAGWSTRLNAAKIELQSFLESKLNVKARGVASRDSMQMASFGLVFDDNPGAGFFPAPRDLAESVSRQGFRGSLYFPDISHPIGAGVMSRLGAISKAAAERPMLTGIKGLRSAAIDGDRLVLSTAKVLGGQVIVLAAAKAVGPDAPLSAAKVGQAALAADMEPNAFLDRVAQVAKSKVVATPKAKSRKPH